MSIKLKSTILLFLTAMIWGFAFVAQRVGSNYLGTFYFNGIRFGLGGISLIPVILIFEKEKKDEVRLRHTIRCGVICGAILFIASCLQQQGLFISQSAGKAGFITGLYTVLVPIFGYMFFKNKTGLLTWIGATLTVIGLFLLSVNSDFTVGFGDIILLIGAFFWAFHVLFIDKFVNLVSPLKFSFVQFLTCSILCLISGFFTEEVSVNSVYMALVPILYSGIMSVGVAYTLQVLGQKGLEPTTVAIICSAESIFSAIGGSLLLKETLTTRGYIGCGIMFSGIIISQLKFSNKKN